MRVMKDEVSYAREDTSPSIVLLLLLLLLSYCNNRADDVDTSYDPSISIIKVNNERPQSLLICIK